MPAIEAPMRRLALRLAQRAMLLAPARKRGEAQAAGDDPVDVLEQQHFGEQILVLRARLELAHRLVTDFEQLGAGYCVLVLLEPLQNELLVLLFERAWGAANGGHPRLGRVKRHGGQHGSTCTVTSSSSRSFFSRASTASAIACASETFAAESTAIVTSA